MKIQKIIVKFFLGMRYCFLKILTFVLFKNTEKPNPKVILVFRTCLLGDFLFALPSLSILKKKFPHAKLIFVTTSQGSSSIKTAAKKYLNNSSSMPWMNFVVPSIIDEVVIIPKFTKANIFLIRKKINNLDPDISFLLPHPGEPFLGLFKKILFLKLIGVKSNFHGWKVKGDYTFFRDAQQELGYFGHKIQGPLRAIYESVLIDKINTKDIDFPIQISTESTNWVDNLFVGQDKKSLKIGISMGSIQDHKQWSSTNFHELSKYLDKKYSVSLFLTGTTNDIGLSKDFSHKGFKRPIIDLIGKTDINQLAALFKKLDIVVSNDGGSAHLAASVGCKVVSIISGIEHPFSIDPWGNFKYSVYHKTKCSPCYSMTFCPEGHKACMRDLSIFSVINKVNLAIADLQSVDDNVMN